MLSLSPIFRSREVAYQVIAGDLDEFGRKAGELMVGFAAESVRMLFRTHLETYLCQATLIHVCRSLTERAVFGVRRGSRSVSNDTTSRSVRSETSLL